MRNKKLSGSFYTPKIIADFMVDYVASKLKDTPSLTVLEPSAGDGIFVKTIFNNVFFSKKINKVIAVEQDEIELNKIGKEVTIANFIPLHCDFLEYQNNTTETFSLVIGNPPYIKKNLLTISQIEQCQTIHKNANLSNNRPKNIWAAFLVRCIEFTDENGILAFVLPSELLQVKFAAELRELILKEFERVEIFTFNELLFKDCKGQDTVLLFAERKSKNKGIYYANISKLSDLSERNFTLSQNIKLKESKWTHSHLESTEIELLEKLKQKLLKVDSYSSSKAGIVTAANDYFIVNPEVVEKYSLGQFVKPIIQKGAYINGSVVLTKEEFQLLIDKSKPTFLVALNENLETEMNDEVISYLKLGKDNQIDKRYKASIRKQWYVVPNIGTPPEAFFFKRCHEYPKLLMNTANVLATDSAYKIDMKQKYKIENFIYSFYNSLTLAFAELYGRYYGGGVLELTPNEFKGLPVPYIEISSKKFDTYVKDFKNKVSIKEICIRNDKAIFKTIDKNFDDRSIEQIANIREKLYNHRIKTN